MKLNPVLQRESFPLEELSSFTHSAPPRNLSKEHRGYTITLGKEEEEEEERREEEKEKRTERKKDSGGRRKKEEKEKEKKPRNCEQMTEAMEKTVIEDAINIR